MLVYRGGKMILRILKSIPKPKQYQPREVIAIDINEEKIVYRNNEINKERGTAIDRAYRWKLLTESLQRRYSSLRYPAWKRKRGNYIATHNGLKPITACPLRGGVTPKTPAVETPALRAGRGS
jgi:hypothetical protein